MKSSKRLGFISTRFAGTDGVSLEAAKWAVVLERMGHECFYFSGICDRPQQVSYIVQEAFFGHPVISAINQAVYGDSSTLVREDCEDCLESESPWQPYFSGLTRKPGISRQVQELKDYLKDHLYQFSRRFNLNALIVENALTIPINLPLGLAVTEFIAETGYPVIAHHHDFYWERQRFMKNSVQDYLAAAFPPNLPSIRHVVINTQQAQQLAARIGVFATVIPNVMDFDVPPPQPDDYVRTARKDLGVAPDQYMLLQPTRIIQRKGIEHAIELVRRLGVPAQLVITHAAGDEGAEYDQRLREFASLLNVDVQFKANIVGQHRGLTPEGQKIYTLEDVYPLADMVTYPSIIEGFGNAFLEAVYYKRPILVNNYAVYETDIKPKGFHVIEIDGFISEKTLEETRYVLTHPEETNQFCDHNYGLGRRYFSFSTLERKMRGLLADCFDEAIF